MLAAYDRVIVPEMNLGQLALLLRAKYLVDVRSHTAVRGRGSLTVHALRSRGWDACAAAERPFCPHVMPGAARLPWWHGQGIDSDHGA